MCFFAIIFGIATNGGIKTIINFLHLPSLIVTLGGALFAVMATADSFEDFTFGLKGIIDAYKNPTISIEHVSNKLLELSETARREGLLSLEQSVDEEDEFFQKGVKLVVDGSSPELVKDIMETELYHKEDRDKKRIKFWQDFAAFAPAWGMVGTLLGLINMMKSMGDNPEAIGAGMSLALITTLYGSVIANWLCVPVSRKLEKSSAKEYLIRELVIEGVLSIQLGENPRIIKENQVNRKNKMANILVGGVLAIISLLFLFMSTFGSESLFAYFIDLPSLIEIVLICAAAVILSEAKGKTEIFKLLRKIVLPVGLFISIFGAIIIITNVSEPGLFLANMSIDLLALLYSILIYIILCVVSYKD